MDTPKRAKHVRIPDDLHAKLTAIAKQERRSLAQMVIILLENSIQHKAEIVEFARKQLTE